MTRESQPILSGTATFEKLLDDLISKAIFRGRDGSSTQARIINGSYESRQKAVDASRLALEEYVAKQEAEIKARGELWGRMCETLHACCQKYHLGLGGEHVDRLVVEEVDRLRSSALTPEEAQQILNAPCPPMGLDHQQAQPYVGL